MRYNTYNMNYCMVRRGLLPDHDDKLFGDLTTGILTTTVVNEIL